MPGRCSHPPSSPAMQSERREPGGREEVQAGRFRGEGVTLPPATVIPRRGSVGSVTCLHANWGLGHHPRGGSGLFASVG